MWVIGGTAHGVEGVGNEPVTTLQSHADQANPRLKVSYRTFSIAGLDATPMWLQGLQVDAYVVSQRWMRFGIELEGGSGSGTWLGTPASLSYGLVGMTVGVQYPARVTPFLEGRFVGGALSGQLDGTLVIGNTAHTGISAATWIYGGGLETGVEVYLHSRVYVSGALGWMRSTWHGLDVPTMMQNPTGGLVYKDLVNDSFTIKVGLGI